MSINNSNALWHPREHFQIHIHTSKLRNDIKNFSSPTTQKSYNKRKKKKEHLSRPLFYYIWFNAIKYRILKHSIFLQISSVNIHSLTHNQIKLKRKKERKKEAQMGLWVAKPIWQNRPKLKQFNYHPY